MMATSASDDVQDFLRFWSALGGEDLVAAGEGATSVEIDRFQALVGFPLPPLYVDYLRLAGRRDDGLDLTNDAFSDIRHLIKLYERRAVRAVNSIPKNGVLIGSEGLSGGRSLIYPETDPLEPQVAVTWSGDVEYVQSATFRNYLYSTAFFRCRVARSVPSSCTSLRDRRALDETVRFALQLGFEPYWFNDTYRACFERPDGAAVQIECRNGTLVYSVARDAGSRDQLRDQFVRQFGMRVEWTR
jgi:hypothetical protein